MEYLCDTCRQLGTHAETCRQRVLELKRRPRKKYRDVVILSTQKELAAAAVAFFKHQHEVHGRPVPEFMSQFQ